LAIACALVALVGGGAASSSAASGAGVLVFSARPYAGDALGWQILVGNLANGHVRRLVRVDGTVSPTWSPDGSEVAYEHAQSEAGACGRPSCSQIWRVDANGMHPRPITSRRTDSEQPDWSSTRRIAFVRPSANDAVNIFISAGLGHAPHRLTNAVGGNSDPAWSPDSQRIAFASGRNGNSELYVINADAGGLRRLTRTKADEYGPAWSPDGTRIAFWRRTVDHDTIVVANADGTNPHTLAGRVRNTEFPAWSPDGKQIAFVKEHDGLDVADIWVMDSDGRNQHKLIDGPFSEPEELDWKPPPPG
jgi:Tol biopolymer transport system component